MNANMKLPSTGLVLFSILVLSSAIIATGIETTTTRDQYRRTVGAEQWQFLQRGS